jgi:predicted Zn-dependent peptidase
MDEINYYYNYDGIDYDAEYEAAVEALSPEGIRKAVADVLESGNFTEVVMMPDKTAERE